MKNKAVRYADSFCGCCGRSCQPTAIWCQQCLAHIRRSGHLWDQTYEAQYSKPCPYQVGLETEVG